MLINGQVVPSHWPIENNYDGGSYYCAPLRMSLVFPEPTSPEMRAQQQAHVKLLAATPDLYEACRAIIDAVETGDEEAAIAMARFAVTKAESK